MPDVAVRQAALDVLLEIFGKTGAAGRVTWFLNEHDFRLTENHPSFLSEAVRRGDVLGVHDHVDFLKGKDSEVVVYDFCAKSFAAVRQWLRQHGGGEDVTWHRWGCLYQRAECYRAIARLGYTVVSDAYPGQKEMNHAGEVSCDCREMPGAIPPWRHDAENFGDYRSRTGQFLHLPLFQMYIHNVDYGKLEQWVALGKEEGRPIPFVWCFHPYEICVKDKARLDEARIKMFEETVRRLLGQYQLEPANFKTLETVYGGRSWTK